MENDVFSVLRRNLEEEKRSIELFMAMGGAKSYEDYVRMAGSYAAYAQVEDNLLSLEKRFIEE